MEDERNRYIFTAKLAEQAERFEEMKESMKKVAEMGEELSVEERNLLSVAYKNVIGARRASWRIVSSIEQKEEGRTRAEEEQAKILGSIKKYRENIETELHKICAEILDLLSEHLVLKASSGESKVFFYKMKGDYHRYEAEFSAGTVREKCAEESDSAYQEAVKHAASQLPPTSPIRLGLALNYSVFHYEIQGDPAKACELAKKAFDGAIAELDSLTEESYKDSTLIMQLLRDNLSLWTSDTYQDETEKEEQQEVEDN